MNKEHVNSLVTRLGRCVGGKLADDVAAAVQEMHEELDRLAQHNAALRTENASLTDSVDNLTRCLDLTGRERDALAKQVEQLTAAAPEEPSVNDVRAVQAAITAPADVPGQLIEAAPDNKAEP